MDPFTKSEINRLTHDINQAAISALGTPGWLYIRSPPELFLDVNTKGYGCRLYAHIPVSNFISDSDPKAWHFHGWVSIWGKDQLPSYPCYGMLEMIRGLYRQEAENLGEKVAHGEHWAYRVRLHTVTWNIEEKGTDWNFGLMHDNARATK